MAIRHEDKLMVTRLMEDFAHEQQMFQIITEKFYRVISTLVGSSVFMFKGNDINLGSVLTDIREVATLMQYESARWTALYEEIDMDNKRIMSYGQGKNN